MYQCLLSLPVLCLLGIVLLLGGQFEGDARRYKQLLADLKASSGLLNISRHISEEAVANHVFWTRRTEDARADLERHVIRTNDLLLNSLQWLPTRCVASLKLLGEGGEEGGSSRLYRRFLHARAGVEFNEEPLPLDRDEFYQFVLSLAVCSMAGRPETDVLKTEIRTGLVYHRLLASSIFLQHLTVWFNYECRFSSESVSWPSHLSNLAKAETYSVLAEFLTKGQLPWFGSVSESNVIKGTSSSSSSDVVDSLTSSSDIMNDSSSLQSVTSDHSSHVTTVSSYSVYDTQDSELGTGGSPWPSRFTNVTSFSLYDINASSFYHVTSNVSCSDEYLSYLQDKLDSQVAQTLQTERELYREMERLVRDSSFDVLLRSFLVAVTVVGLFFAIYLISRIFRRSRQMAKSSAVTLRMLTSQTEQKDKAWDLCVPRMPHHHLPPAPPRWRALHGYLDGPPLTNCIPQDSDSYYTISATALALEIPGLGHVMQRSADCSAALRVMADILGLVEEKVARHQAFVLGQHGASCVVAAVSNNLQCSFWPLCSVADLALDLMTSLADVELTLTSDTPLRPRFGMHTGQAVGYMGTGSPVRYCVVGDLLSSALRCQRSSAPNCVRLTWVTYCALLRLGNYICMESDGNSTEDAAKTPTESGPGLYLAGKRTSHDEGMLHQTAAPTTMTKGTHTPHTPWIFHYV